MSNVMLVASSKGTIMGLLRYLSALASIRQGGPRYDEARRDYEDALRALRPLSR